jgi:alpha-glucosidase (family GH31 glycosyl hydrolase)
MKQALLMRYSLIPFWYTLHYEAAMKSKTVVQPLFSEYICNFIINIDSSFSLLFRYLNDENTYDIDQQFLVGRALLVSPNLLPVITQQFRDQRNSMF